MTRIWLAGIFVSIILLIPLSVQATGPPEGVERAPVLWSEASVSDIPAHVRADAGPGERLLPSQIIEGEFDMIGLLWEEGAVEHLWVQTRDERGRWRGWTEVPVVEDHGEDRPGSRPGSAPIYTGDATAARFIAAGVVQGAEVMMIDTKALTPDESAGARVVPAGPLQVVSSTAVPLPAPWWQGASFVRDRAEWDGTDCRRPEANYHFATPRAIAVHHTAGSNNYTETDVPGIISGHCVFHVEGRGWDDLAYNFMVDRFGNVWEGRTSSKTTASRGGHIAGFNSETQGVAMMGSFESSAPGSTHVGALRRILNWLTGWHSIDPQGEVTLYAGLGNLGGWDIGDPVTVPTIVAHRDLGTTSCPGEAFYATLPTLRASLLPDDFGFDPSAITCNGLKPTIFGTLGHDQMRGTKGPDVIHGLAGSDLIYALGGDDTVCGGVGNDYLIPGLDRDQVFGESGTDTCGGEGMGSCEVIANDEIFFYRDDGLFRYYNIRTDGTLPLPLLAGSGYTTDWDVITAVDLDGDGQDEMFFYRDDGVFRFYDVRPDGTLGSPIREGDGYTTGWSSITAVDLDGGGQDEMLFYREDGLYRYYNVGETGDVGLPIASGGEYTTGWSSIVALDLDGDFDDELLFYREDGLFRYYDIRSDASLPLPMLSGDGYTTGWDSISAVDLDADSQDEMLFYREDGLYRYYHIRADATLPKPVLGGAEYTAGWNSITSVDLDDIPYSTPPLSAH